MNKLSFTFVLLCCGVFLTHFVPGWLHFCYEWSDSSLQKPVLSVQKHALGQKRFKILWYNWWSAICLIYWYWRTMRAYPRNCLEPENQLGVLATTQGSSMKYSCSSLCWLGLLHFPVGNTRTPDEWVLWSPLQPILCKREEHYRSVSMAIF